MNKIYVAIDGNEIGKIIEKYLFCENLEELSKFSTTMNDCIIKIGLFIEKNKGILIMSGGDNILAGLPEDAFPSLKKYISKCSQNTNFSFSIGISTYPLGSYFALKYAKANHLYCVKFADGIFSEC